MKMLRIPWFSNWKSLKRKIAIMISFFQKVFIVFFMMVFLGLIGWLFLQALRPEIFPVGSMMPELKYQNPEGTHILKRDTRQNTMIVLFHQQCDHCRYQLEQFNDHFNDFIGAKIFIFTTEQQFFKDSNLNQWPRLSNSGNVFWGIVDRTEFKNKFGSTATPSIFFFNESGTLYHKIQGERRIEKILEILQDSEKI